MIIAQFIDRNGGLVTTEQLVRRGGYWPSLIQQSVGYGRIVRVRRGWYATPATHPAIVAACRARGRLTCVSAIQFYEGRVVTHPLHIAVPHTSGRHVREVGLLVRHWTSEAAGGDARVVSESWARAQLTQCWAVPPLRSDAMGLLQRRGEAGETVVHLAGERPFHPVVE